MSGRPIVLAAGGTGGHLFPAAALAAELKRRGREPVLLTDRRAGGYEERFPGVPVHVVRSATFAGRGVLGKIRAVGEIALGAGEARGLLRRLGVALAVGFGGYPSLPTMLAAQIVGIPTLVHEQNARLGRVNRLLVRRASAIALSFDKTLGLGARERAKAVVTGNPVRAAIAAVRAQPYAAPAEGPIRFLVLGGSQGARVLSDVVPAALSALEPSLRTRLHVVQQCRAEDVERVRAVYAAGNIRAELAAFIEDVPALLGTCHLAITRAGASTVSELAVAGRPAVLVPYLHAMDDHQTANADALASMGGARILAQPDFSPERLCGLLTELLSKPGELARMAQAAQAAGMPDAAIRLADLVERLAPANGAAAAGPHMRAA